MYKFNYLSLFFQILRVIRYQRLDTFNPLTHEYLTFNIYYTLNLKKNYTKKYIKICCSHIFTKSLRIYFPNRFEVPWMVSFLLKPLIFHLSFFQIKVVYIIQHTVHIYSIPSTKISSSYNTYSDKKKYSSTYF